MLCANKKGTNPLLGFILLICDYFRTSVIFQVPDNLVFVGDIHGSSELIHARSLQSFIDIKTPTYSIIAFFKAPRFVDVALFEIDVNIYIGLADIFATDLFVLRSDLEEHRPHISFLFPLKH